MYAHIARYNFWYLTNEMKLPPAQGINIDTLEAMRNKEQIVALLRRSSDYVKRSMAAMLPDDEEALPTVTAIGTARS